MGSGLRVVRGSRQLMVGIVVAVVLAAGSAAAAEPDQVDGLLDRLFGAGERGPYLLTADFSGYILATVAGTQLRADAEGSFREWRGRDNVRRRTVRLQTLRLPLLLRPFAGTLRRALEDKVEAQADAPEAFLQHDVFILTRLPAGRYVLAGVQRSIVTDAITRFGRAKDQEDTLTRREIARWLYTSAPMRSFLVRAGPPYAFRAIVDDTGLLHELVLSYDWGALSTKVDFVMVSGQPVARRIVADTASEVSGVGRVTGQLLLTFFNHCVNCTPP
jgi:hypothetical protein